MKLLRFTFRNEAVWMMIFSAAPGIIALLLVLVAPGRELACILPPMPARPKDKSAATPVERDRVSLVVALGITALTAGGILAIFSAPLLALLGR